MHTFPYSRLVVLLGCLSFSVAGSSFPTAAGAAGMGDAIAQAMASADQPEKLSARSADSGAEDKAVAGQLRPEIITILTAAKSFSAEKNWGDALKKLHEADVLANKTLYETYVIERTRGSYAIAAGDKAMAAAAFEAVVATNYLPAADQLTMIQAIAGTYYQLKNYPKAISWFSRYQTQGGQDAKAHNLLNQAYFLNDDFADAYTGLSADVQATIKAGGVPTLQTLQMLVNCTQKQNDKDGYIAALEQLINYYPKKEYWAELLYRISSRPTFSEHLHLDLYRLQQEVGVIDQAGDYVDMAQLALRSGLPAEAKKILGQGYAAGVLGTGPNAKKYEALRDTAVKHAADDIKTMQQGEAGAFKSKDGAGLVNLGMAYVTAGQADKGVAMMEQGLNKGGLTRLEEAKLHLGIAIYWAGNKSAALSQLKTVQGNDGSADLARLWMRHISGMTNSVAGSVVK